MPPIRFIYLLFWWLYYVCSESFVYLDSLFARCTPSDAEPVIAQEHLYYSELRKFVLKVTGKGYLIIECPKYENDPV